MSDQARPALPLLHGRRQATGAPNLLAIPQTLDAQLQAAGLLGVLPLLHVALGVLSLTQHWRHKGICHTASATACSGLKRLVACQPPAAGLCNEGAIDCGAGLCPTPAVGCARWGPRNDLA